MKIYITFGQIHKHIVNGKVFDRNCVAVFESKNEYEGRKKAFWVFGNQWHNLFPANQFNNKLLIYFPRGLLQLDGFINNKQIHG